MELYSKCTRITCLIIVYIYFLIGTVGNALIIWTIFRLKHLRSMHNVIVASLAACDFLIIGYLLTMNMEVLISNKEPNFHHCRFHAVVSTFLFICCLQLIMLIALSRFIKICHSGKYNTVFTVQTLAIVVTVIFGIDTIFCSSMWFDDDMWIFDKPLQTCFYNRYKSSVASAIGIAITMGLPFVVTLFCYFEIHRQVMKSRKQIHLHLNNGLNRRLFAHENMVTRTQFAGFVMYMTLYMPMGITFYGKRSDFPEAFHTISLYLCFFNSCMNCILYGVLNKNMRKGYTESLPCIHWIHIQRNKIAPASPVTMSVINTTNV